MVRDDVKHEQLTDVIKQFFPQLRSVWTRGGERTRDGRERVATEECFLHNLLQTERHRATDGGCEVDGRARPPPDMRRREDAVNPAAGATFIISYRVAQRRQ